MCVCVVQKAIAKAKKDGGNVTATEQAAHKVVTLLLSVCHCVGLDLFLLAIFRIASLVVCSECS